MKISTTIFIATAGFFFSAANAQDMKGMKMDAPAKPATTMKMDAPMKKSAPIPDYSKASPAVKSGVGVLFNDYLGVKDALVQSSLSKAQAAGKLLSSDAAHLNLAGLTPAQHKYAADLLDLIKEDGEHIGKTPELEHQRHHFAELTDEIYPLVKAFKPAVGKVYYDYCPMARAHKGAYWMTRESVIKNPFYGSKMIECGMTKETL